MIEDDTVGWHPQLNGHGFGWTPRVGDGQGGLVWYSSWGRKELDTTEQLKKFLPMYCSIITMITFSINKPWLF